MERSADKLTPGANVSIVVILSGPNRGRTESLVEDSYRIVVHANEALFFFRPDDKRAQKYHATLHRVGDAYEVAVPADHTVWVNGEQVTGSRLLKSGDLLEIGRRGPVVRYRIYPPGTIPRKSVAEAIMDSFDGAQADGLSRMGRFSAFLANVTRDLATQTTLWFRIWILIILTALVGSVVILIAQSMRLEKKVAREEMRIGSIEQRLAKQDTNTLTMKDLVSLKEEVNKQLANTLNRLAEMEKAPGKASRLIADATPSVVFLMGAYGLHDPKTNKMLRSVEVESGVAHYELGDEGRVVELVFSGTAFVVSQSGLLLTSRHVIEPWKSDQNINIAQGRDLEPQIQKLFAYYPGSSERHSIEVAYVDNVEDLAILHVLEPTTPIAPLLLHLEPPLPGDEVILLGYPAGLRALVARASPEFLKSLTPDGPIDYWTLAQRLLEAGFIKPLATRGIVGQVTSDTIVYDAETTFGGSGGPVLDMKGHVIAINSAVMPEFRGSNLGITATRIRSFLDRSAASVSPAKESETTLRAPEGSAN